MAKIHEVLVLGRILNIASGDLGSADTSYTYIGLGSEELTHASLQLTLSNTTITLEGSNDLDSVLDANAEWTDITELITGVTSITASGMHVIDTKVPIARLRIKRLTTNATNSCAIRVTKAS